MDHAPADGEVVWGSAEKEVEVELLREVLETLGDGLAQEGVEGEVTPAGVPLHARELRIQAIITRTYLVRDTVRVEVAAGEGQILVAALVIEVHACTKSRKPAVII